ncbi:zinc finger protein 845 [Scaptodrosophila lebanonensis]|uniref:Zinc finger protein 845 n=1 Tax=Drosophila lebanonensis TaxID=7225 RepID=A0A6J2U8B5_DROLE|nr:zinc finger protein 845 [Scaptodrosophila lebanonensis]
MSASPKPNCLYCRTSNPKFRYQDIFDEVGIEIGLSTLLFNHFQFEVKQKTNASQFLCEVCVNTLIKFFDIAELEKERNEGEKNSSGESQKKKLTIVPKPQEPGKPKAKIAILPKPKAASSSRPVVHVEAPSVSAAGRTLRSANKQSVSATQKSNPVGAAEIKPASGEFMPVANKIKPVVKIVGKKKKTSEQEEINALMQNILSDEELRPADDVATEITSDSETSQTIDESKIVLGAEISYNEMDKLAMQSMELLDDDEEFINASQSGNDTADDDKLDPMDLVPIKKSDNVGDLYEYLETVVKTEFENLFFDWSTECRHCRLKFSTFDRLLAHMQKQHKKKPDIYQCPISDCEDSLKGHRRLAKHLVLRHAPLHDLQIYGSCPECKMTFSNFITYNKHSCAHIFKKRRGLRLYCKLCNQEFPSWKRYSFHKQFHMEKHRPRACFICNSVDYNLEELFRHLHYAHEPEGTLFCDLCDRTFCDQTNFDEHRSAHANVGTFPCSECSLCFDTRGRLTGHMRTSHGELVTCDLCPKEFASEVSLNLHVKTHLIIERLLHVCSKCGLLSENQEKMLAHSENEDGGRCYGAEVLSVMLRSAFVCEYCMSYFRTKGELKNHRDTGIHKDGLYWCQPCYKEFSDIKLYRHHLRLAQASANDVAHRKLDISLYYMCNYKDCLVSYINWNSLYTHKRRTHFGGRHDSPASNSPAETAESKSTKLNLTCQFCKKDFRTKMSLAVHVARSHNNNNVTCDQCSSSYKDAEALQKHVEYWHQSIECPVCYKVVKNRRNYDTHFNVVHSKNKRYNCGKCEKGFYHKSERDAHEKLHTQSFRCDLCNFTTRNKASLDVHVQGQHLKKFSFQCEICNKCFGRRQGLNAHIQRVHGIGHVCRDYFEKGCTKSFSSMQQLNIHVRKVHHSTILLTDEIIFSEDEVEAEEQQDEEQPAKRRCFKIDDTSIEFIGIEGQSNSTDGKEFKVSVEGN